MKQVRMKELDSLRGLAALSVVFFHYSNLYDSWFGHAKQNYILNFKYGSYGVHLFFIISGFVIYMTILRSNNVKEFIIKRTFRLYPAYLTSVTLTFTLVIFFGLNGMSKSLIDYLFNLTMLQGVIPGTGIKLIDGSYWSLGIEITFYIFCAILLSIGLLNKSILISGIWLFGIFLIKILHINNLITPIIGDLGIVNYSNLFIAGIMFYKLKVNNSVTNHVMIVLSLLYQYSFHGILSGLIVSTFFLIFYALIKNKLSFLSVKSLTFLGTISYSLYLVHQNIGYIIINFLEQLGFVNEVFIIIPILISVGIATVITFYIEKPIQRMLLTKYNLKKYKGVPVKKGIA